MVWLVNNKVKERDKKVEKGENKKVKMGVKFLFLLI